MAVVIRVSLLNPEAGKSATATVENGKWATNNDMLKTLLVGIDEYALEGYHPHIDHSIAELAVELLGGEIISSDLVERVESRVY